MGISFNKLMEKPDKMHSLARSTQFSTKSLLYNDKVKLDAGHFTHVRLETAEERCKEWWFAT